MSKYHFRRFLPGADQQPPRKDQFIPRKKPLRPLCNPRKTGSVLVWDSQLLGTYVRREHGPLKISKATMMERSRLFKQLNPRL